MQVIDGGICVPLPVHILNGAARKVVLRLDVVGDFLLHRHLLGGRAFLKGYRLCDGILPLLRGLGSIGSNKHQFSDLRKVILPLDRLILHRLRSVEYFLRIASCLLGHNLSLFRSRRHCLPCVYASLPCLGSPEGANMSRPIRQGFVPESLPEVLYSSPPAAGACLVGHKLLISSKISLDLKSLVGPFDRVAETIRLLVELSESRYRRAQSQTSQRSGQRTDRESHLLEGSRSLRRGTFGEAEGVGHLPAQRAYLSKRHA